MAGCDRLRAAAAPSEPAETGDGNQGLELTDLHRHQHSVWV